MSVSSTKIRKALQNGEVDLANDYLGYPFKLKAKVVRGRQIGRTIEFPTANLELDDSLKIIPKNGVYKVDVLHNNECYGAMMNIGINPTIGGQQKKLEVHIFDFDGDLYQETIEVFFSKRIRDEKQFDSLDQLKNQLQKDKHLILNS